MDFFQDFGWYLLGFTAVVFGVSFLHYKAYIEQKGKKFLLIPFVILLVLHVALIILSASTCHGEGCMGAAFLVFGIPFVVVIPLLLELIIFYLFRCFKITDKKRLRSFWMILGLVCILPIVLLGFSPGDANGIEQQAIATGSLKKCDSIIFYFSARDNRTRRESCKLQVAKVINNFDVCKTFQTKQIREACVSWAVARTGQTQWCDLLSAQETSHCEQIIQTTNWMKENYCTYGSYTSCLGSICPGVFLNDKYQIGVESSVNTCLQKFAIEKNQESACMKILSIPGWPGHGDATRCSRFLSEMRNLSDVCPAGQNHLDCLNTTCPDHRYSLDYLNGCFIQKAIKGLDIRWCQRIINGEPGSCENQISARQRNLL